MNLAALRKLKFSQLLLPLLSLFTMMAIFWSLFSWWQLSRLRLSLEQGKKQVSELPILVGRIQELERQEARNQGRKTDDLVNYLKVEVPTRHAKSPAPDLVQEEEKIPAPSGQAKEVPYKVTFNKIRRRDLVRYLWQVHAKRPFLEAKELSVSQFPERQEGEWKAEIVLAFWEPLESPAK